MISLLISGTVAFVITIFVTPIAIRELRKRSLGQFIQEEVPMHSHKKGTPTMGGVVMWVAVTVGYVVAHFRFWSFSDGWTPSIISFSVEGWLVIMAFLGMGVIGFLDDYAKFAQKRNLGLSKRWKFLGQVVIASLFVLGTNVAGVSTKIFVTRSIGADLGPLVYGLFVLFMLLAMANAVNFTDGLDGLVAGSGSMVFGAYVLIAFWQFRNPDYYGISSALDLGMVAAAIVGALAGFLWWNAAPAKIIMGDSGSQALGGALAGLALLTQTHFLVVILGGLYVMEAASVVLQIFTFRTFGKRIFLMAPIHHHFEIKGWPETVVTVRFWILSGMAVAIGVGLFYAEFLAVTDRALAP
ncbi:MAG TPA: phospho-N-acetylmuramoyl-pentapeptide-transferase [Actinobacteria bacterium]|nr:phospho-N-acetylmuramoyl-pentapeptide-transferase [bacterium BMS3Bbin02]HDL41538.1 phospho-N-acetylmuramoyl-pentapeptide-transferase [Actinomycetota bacterium]